MPKLKDYFASDLEAFLNADEFAEYHNIDDQQIKCVLDIFQQQKYRGQRSVYEGVYISTKQLYVKASDFPDRPVIGQDVRVDGKLYLVTNCSEFMGMLEITLEANEA